MSTLRSNIERLKNTFANIRDAIEAKGVTPGNSVDDFAINIRNIPSAGQTETLEVYPTFEEQLIEPPGGVTWDAALIHPSPGIDPSDTTATPGNVVTGKTFYTADGVLTDGTLAELKTISGGWVGNEYKWTAQDNAYVPKAKNYSIVSVDNLQGGTKYATLADQTIVPADTRGYFASAVTISKITQTNLEAKNVLKGTTVNINNGERNLFSIVGSARRTAFGTVTTTANTAKDVILGWKPSYVFVFRNRSSSYVMANMYYAGTNLNVTTGQSSSSSTANITVANTGFTLAAQGTYYGTCYYIAIE